MLELMIIGAVAMIAFPVALIAWATKGRAARYDVMGVGTSSTEDAYLRHEGPCAPSRRNVLTGAKAVQHNPAKVDALPPAFEAWMRNHNSKVAQKK